MLDDCGFYFDVDKNKKTSRTMIVIIAICAIICNYYAHYFNDDNVISAIYNALGIIIHISHDIESDKILVNVLYELSRVLSALTTLSIIIDSLIAFKHRSKEINKIKKGIEKPGPRDYPGPNAISEIETKNMIEFTKLINFDMTISLHSQGKEIYWNYLNYKIKNAYEIGKKFEKVSRYLLIGPLAKCINCLFCKRSSSFLEVSFLIKYLFT